MMKCDAAREDLGAYVDGALTPPQHDAIAHHVSECATCREDEAILRSLREEVAALPAPALPLDFDERVMAAVRPVLERRARRGRFGSRLRDMLGHAADLLFGPRDAVAVGSGSFALGTLGLAAVTTSFALIGVGSLRHFVQQAGIVPRTTAECVEGFPTLTWSAQASGWLLTVLVVSAFVIVLRLLGARATHARARAGKATAADVAGMCVAAVVAYILLDVPYVWLTYQYWTSPADTYFLPLLSVVAVDIGCLYGWWVFARGRMHQVALLAAAFYVSLWLAWGGTSLLLATVTSARMYFDTSILGLLGRAAVLRIVLLGAPSLGVFVGALAVRAGSATLPRRLRRAASFVCVAAFIGLAFCVVEVSNELGVGLADNYGGEVTAAIEPSLATPRAIVLLSSEGHNIFGYVRSGWFRADNVARLRSLVASAPRTLAAAWAHRLLLLGAATDWDGPAQTAELWSYLTAPGTQIYAIDNLLWRLSTASPTADNVELVRALQHDDRLVTTDAGIAAMAFVRTYDGLGAATDAAPLRAAAAAAAAGGRVGVGTAPPRTVAMRDGQVSGRLVVDGLPWANQSVRLLGVRGGGEDRKRTEAQVLQDPSVFQPSFEQGRRAYNAQTYIPMVVTRTDGDGRFHFAGLADDTYCLAIQMDGDADACRARYAKARLPHAIRVDTAHRQVEAGEIRIGGRP